MSELKETVTETELRQILTPFGTIRRINIDSKFHNAYIEFSSEEEVTAVIDSGLDTLSDGSSVKLTAVATHST
eukprot:GABW01004771.1.p2 GENE.GABW01004771.1~~GABW01004771.1.p2  ORF type:complete len:73 (-),score=26.32 GABW01004771.1:3-221(-)